MIGGASKGCRVHTHVTLAEILPENFITHLGVLTTPTASEGYGTLGLRKTLPEVCIARLEVLVAPMFSELVRFLACLVVRCAS